MRRRIDKLAIDGEPEAGFTPHGRREPQSAAVAQHERTSRQLDGDARNLPHRLRQKLCRAEPGGSENAAAISPGTVGIIETPAAQPPPDVVGTQARERLLEHARPLFLVKEESAGFGASLLRRRGPASPIAGPQSWP